jgi:hypothetical protein
MGGAFVAVASDATATWWNPGGLGAGPFLDLSLARTSTEVSERLPAWRSGTSWFAIGSPPLGLAYYRFRLTDIRPFDPTGERNPDREDRRAGVPVRSLSVSHFGVTVVQTLIPGVHAGTTLKYLRGTLQSGRADGLLSADALLEVGEELDDGNSQGRFDLDAGIIAVAGMVRLGAVVRNVREPEFDTDDAAGMRVTVRLPRQVRIGAAFDPERATGIPLTVAVDADVRAYETASGERRVVAAGAEHWFGAKRFGVRAGGRVNTVGRQERSATAGASVALRSGLFVDGHVVRGGSADEKGWGVAARVSF